MQQKNLDFNRSFLNFRKNHDIATVPAPINGAACIQKLLFEPSDYHVKMT